MIFVYICIFFMRFEGNTFKDKDMWILLLTEDILYEIHNDCTFFVLYILNYICLTVNKNMLPFTTLRTFREVYIVRNIMFKTQNVASGVRIPLHNHYVIFRICRGRLLQGRLLSRLVSKIIQLVELFVLLSTPGLHPWTFTI